MLRINERQARRIVRAAYIADFNARSPAEIELDLIEMKDGVLSDADKARRAHLQRAIRDGEG